MSDGEKCYEENEGMEVAVSMKVFSEEMIFAQRPE